MRKIGIIGAFDFKNMSTGGQPVKTRQLYATLSNLFGKGQVIAVETHAWKKNPLPMLIGILKVYISCDSIFMLPASNGVKYFSKILVNIKKKRGVKIYYDVIGGWLPQLIKNNDKLKHQLMDFDCIIVETDTMKRKLVNIGFNNVQVIPNFKKINPIHEKEISNTYNEPFLFCTFSRVMKEKGIEDAINAIIKVNKQRKRCVCKLDIYGPIDSSYETEFKKILEKSPEYITYKGVADPYESVKVLKNYYALLFPTKFYTEGIPGTIIDAYAAGVPVISANWESCLDIIKDQKTGLAYSFDDIDDFYQKINVALEDSERWMKMKSQCLIEYQKYTETYFINKLHEYTTL